MKGAELQTQCFEVSAGIAEESALLTGAAPLRIYMLYTTSRGAMSTNLIVRIEETTQKRFSRLVRIEGKSASEKVHELIDGYIKKADIGVVVDDLWDRVGTKLRIKGPARA